MKAKPTGSDQNKVVMGKISRDEYSKLQKYCELKKESVNSVIKRLVTEELEDPVPHMLAGKNIFLYNKHKDNFSWRILLDKEIMAYIEDDLPAESLLQLQDAIQKAIDERNTYINKNKEESVPIPSKLVRKRI
ncbi:MAG: hypothetical protein KJ597_02280 [Nanoarchaeota archaeon]|nr:hypothetical protein [Nanoarchaeota archaeon]